MSPNSDDLLNDASNCVSKEPGRALALCNRYLAQYPGHPHGLFSRHQAWLRLGKLHKALEDITAVLATDADAVSYFSRAEVYRALGDHEHAVEDITKARQLDEPEHWLHPIDLQFRADSLARLGRLEEALADCASIPEDYSAPAHHGLPGGNKQQFVKQIRARAAAARGPGK